MAGPVRVGLIGAGPWVPMFYAPILSGGPETEFTGVWARRPEAAAAVAEANGTRAFASLEAMFEEVDAVVVCVAPAAQAKFAIAAAEAGKALILEKPLAETLAEAEALAHALDGAPAMLMLTNRYNAPLRERLAQARAFETYAARGQFLSGGFLPGSPFAFGWRLEKGALLDVGPHIIDLAWEALGPVVGVRASGDPLKVAVLELEHESGVRTQLLISATVALERQEAGLELFGPAGRFTIDPVPGRDSTPAILRHELAEMVRTRKPHAVGVERGLALQRIIAEAERQLAR